MTQAQALDVICDLIPRVSAIRDEFLKAGLSAELDSLCRYCHTVQNQYRYLAHGDPDIDILLASSRKALVFAEESEVHTVAKPLISLHSWEVEHKPYCDKIAFIPALLHACTTLLRYMYVGDEG